MGSLWRAPARLISSCSWGYVVSLFITTCAGTWYDALINPDFLPPGSVFLPVWLVLYGLMAAALYIIWSRDPNAREWMGWVPLFFAHLLLNVGWVVLFFGFHAVFIAFVDIVALAFSILILISGAWAIDKRAAFLLIPYLLWVLFSTALNASIWYL